MDDRNAEPHDSLRRRFLPANKRTTLGIGTILLFIAVLAGLLLLPTPSPVAHIRVVDEAGQPLRGATITPDGLRPKKGGGHYWWNRQFDRGVPVDQWVTDDEGYAAVRYPYYVDERLETEQISFAVDHPDFCPDRPFRTVAQSPPANAPLFEHLKHMLARVSGKISSRPDPVIMKRGGIIQITAHLGDPSQPLTGLHAELSHSWAAGTNFWQRNGPLMFSRKVTPGLNHLRVIHLPSNGPVHFSAMTSLHPQTGQTNEFVLELKPGVRVTGRFDPSVPRPVRNGHVNTRVFADGHDGNSTAPVWVAWRTVGADGEFEFPSLPPGRMELIGMCDGFVSTNGQQLPGFTGDHRQPQRFPIVSGISSITLAMEPAAAYAITVLDDSGAPLPGARASFWPNVTWGGNGATIFCHGAVDTETLLRDPTWNWQTFRATNEYPFAAISDQNGIALVRNLPGDGTKDFSITHTNFEMPVVQGPFGKGRSANADLVSGKTNAAVVRMKKRGTEEITH